MESKAEQCDETKPAGSSRFTSLINHGDSLIVGVIRQRWHVRPYIQNRLTALEHMWDTQTFWFDVALVMGIFAIGNILLGHFEEHRPKWRRLLKVVIVLSLAVCLSHFGLRWATYTILSIIAIGAGYIHLVWLPKHGINGWTGEPKQKYYELIGVETPPSQSFTEETG